MCHMSFEQSLPFPQKTGQNSSPACHGFLKVAIVIEVPKL